MTRIATLQLRWLSVILCLLLGASRANAQCTGPGGSCWAPSGSAIYNTNTGAIGFGTNSPAFKFDFVNSDPGVSSQVRIINKDTGLGSGGGLLFGVGNTALTGAITSKLNGTSGNADLYFRTAASGTLVDRLHILANGNIGIGTASPTATLQVIGTVVGTNIQAQYQDLAEWVTVRGSADPGTVVVIQEGAIDEVEPAHKAYDMGVAGVISGKPGIVLGEAGQGKATVATAGRVKVKVDASKAPVKVGDLLVTSDRSGFAMRSEPVEIAGVRIHRPGTLIGKALEPLEKGEGEILVLLSLQ